MVAIRRLLLPFGFAKKKHQIGLHTPEFWLLLLLVAGDFLIKLVLLIYASAEQHQHKHWFTGFFFIFGHYYHYYYFEPVVKVVSVFWFWWWWWWWWQFLPLSPSFLVSLVIGWQQTLWVQNVCVCVCVCLLVLSIDAGNQLLDCVRRRRQQP